MKKIIGIFCIFLFPIPTKTMLLRRLSRTSPYTTSTARMAPSTKTPITPSKASEVTSWISAQIRGIQQGLQKYNPFSFGQKQTRFYSTTVPIQNIATQPIKTPINTDVLKESNNILEQLNALKPEEQTGKSISIAEGNERFYIKIPKDSPLREQIQSFLEKNTIYDIENVFFNLIELWEGQELIFRLMQKNPSFAAKVMPLFENYFAKIVGPIKGWLFSLNISEPNASQIMDNLKVRYVSGFRTVDIPDIIDDLPQYLPKNSLQFMKVLSHIYREANDQTWILPPGRNRLVMDYLKDREKFNDLLLQTLEQRSDLSTIFLETLETKNYFQDNRNLLARLLTKKPHYSSDILKAMNIKQKQIFKYLQEESSVDAYDFLTNLNYILNSPTLKKIITNDIDIGTFITEAIKTKEDPLLNRFIVDLIDKKPSYKSMMVEKIFGLQTIPSDFLNAIPRSSYDFLSFLILIQESTALRDNMRRLLTEPIEDQKLLFSLFGEIMKEAYQFVTTSSNPFDVSDTYMIIAKIALELLTKQSKQSINYLETLFNLEKEDQNIPSTTHFKNFTKDIITMYAPITYDPNIQKMVHDILLKEKELVSADYEVFYHGRRRVYGF